MGRSAGAAPAVSSSTPAGNFDLLSFGDFSGAGSSTPSTSAQGGGGGGGDLLDLFAPQTPSVGSTWGGSSAAAAPSTAFGGSNAYALPAAAAPAPVASACDFADFSFAPSMPAQSPMFGAAAPITCAGAA